MKKYIFLLLLLLFPYNVFAEDLIPNGKSGILIEAKSGKIIYEKDKDKKMSIASLTKMIGQIIILEEIEAGNIKWTDVVTVSKNASDMGGSQIDLEEGEKISVEDLMKGISVSSGNDAIVAMAEYISGSESKFVQRMNRVAKKLKLKNTHFSNCTGLDEKDHYSTSNDLSIVARDLILNHPDILKFSSIYEDYLRENTDRKFWLVNTNKLINFYDGADGLKTGHTDDAGYCLAATALRNNLRLIGIVLGEENSKIRNQEMIEMLDYGFNNTKLNCILEKEKVIDKLSFDKTDISSVDVVLKNDLCILEDKVDKNKYKYDIKYNNYSIPLKKGDNIGKIIVKHKDKIISEENITVNSDVNKIGVVKFVKNNVFRLLFGI